MMENNTIDLDEEDMKDATEEERIKYLEARFGKYMPNVQFQFAKEVLRRKYNYIYSGDFEDLVTRVFQFIVDRIQTTTNDDLSSSACDVRGPWKDPQEKQVVYTYVIQGFDLKIIKPLDLDNEFTLELENTIEYHKPILRFHYIMQYGFKILLNEIDDNFIELSSNRKMNEIRRFQPVTTED